jgi:hypothetical protein
MPKTTRYQTTRMGTTYRVTPGQTKAVIPAATPKSLKEEFPHWEQEFLTRGMATLSMDGPGQGEVGAMPTSPRGSVMGVPFSEGREAPTVPTPGWRRVGDQAWMAGSRGPITGSHVVISVVAITLLVVNGSLAISVFTWALSARNSSSAPHRSPGP